ncbi:MAG: hypothetical protein Q4C47_05685, partial [Planctomycetia bacterium]|nr:hypothetical protein [Planctomycetia bacterium]
MRYTTSRIITRIIITILAFSAPFFPLSSPFTHPSLTLSHAQESAPTDPDALEFLHALQNRGYYDLSIDYLNRIKESGSMPGELTELWDLEMSRNLVEMSSRAYNEEESAKLLEQAKEHLSAFLEKNPDHPDASRSLTIWGDFSRNEAQKTLDALEDPELTADRRAELLAIAEKQLEEAKSRYTDARKQLTAKLEALPPAPAQTGKRPSKAWREWVAQKQAITDASVQAKFQLALIDYLTAQTMDPKYTGEKEDTRTEARRALYEKAAGEFDSIY